MYTLPTTESTEFEGETMQIPIRKTLRRKGIRKLPMPATIKTPALNLTGAMVTTGKVPKLPKLPSYSKLKY